MAALAASQPPAEGLPPPLKPSFAAMVRGTLDPAPETYKEASTYKGEPALHYSAPEISDLSSPLRFALIGKFLADRPSMEFLRHGFKTIGFKGAVQLGLMDPRHVLIRFDLEDDYHRCWLHSTWRFRDHIMKVLKWTPDFSVKEEPPVVPVWVSLDQLPLFLFARSPLFSIGRLLGKPLKLDAATISLSRPSVARICVEVDLRQPLPSRLWLGLPKGGFWQPLKYENLPAYCFDCCSLGHLQSDCGKQIEPTQVWRVKSVPTLAAAVNPTKVLASTQIASPAPSPNAAPVVQDPGLLSPSVTSVLQDSQPVVASPADAHVVRIASSPNPAVAPNPAVLLPVAHVDHPATHSGLSSAEKAFIPVMPSALPPSDDAAPLPQGQGLHATVSIDHAQHSSQLVQPQSVSLVQASSPTAHLDVSASSSGKEQFGAVAVDEQFGAVHPQCQRDLVHGSASLPVQDVVSAGCTVAPPLHEMVAPTMSHVDPSPSSDLVDVLVQDLIVSQEIGFPVQTIVEVAASDVDEEIVIHDGMGCPPDAPPLHGTVAPSTASTVAPFELLPTPLSAGSVHSSYKHVLMDKSLQGIPSDAIVESPNRQTKATFAATHVPTFDTGYGYSDSDYYQDTLVSDEHTYEDTDEHTYEDITDGSEGAHMTKRKDRRKLKGGVSTPLNDFTSQSRLLDMRIRKRGRPPGSRNRTFFDVHRTMSTRATRATSD